MLASAGTDSRHYAMRTSERRDFLEDVARALDFGVFVAENEPVEVLQPDLAAVRVGEGVEAFLVDAEGFFVAVVLLEIGCVVQNVLRSERRGERGVLEA